MTSAVPRRPPLDPSRLRELGHALAVHVLPESASTNADLADRARAGAGEGTVLVAEHQTAGRGRLGRGWETPARSALTFSVLLRPDIAPDRWPWLPLLTGCAVAATLREHGYAAGLKWPNDVLIGGKKVCGILLERVETASTGSTSGGPAAILGVGLNTTSTADEVPETATSLWLETGEEPDRTAILASLLRTLRATYDAWRGATDDGSLRASYLGLCVTLGHEVRVELPGSGQHGAEPLLGTAVDIDPGGRLVVDAPTGRVAVGAGDVVHVRPASGGWGVTAPGPGSGEVT